MGDSWAGSDSGHIGRAHSRFDGATLLTQHVFNSNTFSVKRPKQKWWVMVTTKYLTFHTKKRKDFVRITDEVEEVVQGSGIKEGMVLVSAMHITAGVYINDAEDGLLHDIGEWLEKIAPENPKYLHHRTGEDNGDAHLKNLVIGHQVIVPITKGKLDLGTWQQIYYAEFDGQRDKRVIVKALGE